MQLFSGSGVSPPLLGRAEAGMCVGNCAFRSGGGASTIRGRKSGTTGTLSRRKKGLAAARNFVWKSKLCEHAGTEIVGGEVE